MGSSKFEGRDWRVLPSSSASRKEKIQGPITAVQDNLERAILDRCDFAWKPNCKTAKRRFVP